MGGIIIGITVTTISIVGGIICYDSYLDNQKNKITTRANYKTRIDERDEVAKEIENKIGEFTQEKIANLIYERDKQIAPRKIVIVDDGNTNYWEVEYDRIESDE